MTAILEGGQLVQSRGCRRRSGKSGVGEHGLNGLDARYGLLGEGETERDGPEQFAVNIDRAAAHTLEDAGFCQWAAAEPGKDDGLLWTEILEHAEDFDLELFDAVALKDGPADAPETGTHILEWEEVLSAGNGG
jgi:hypothetical protein